MVETDTTLKELRKIAKILLLANAPLVQKEIEKIANSDARKKMWVLTDGTRMQKDIANEVKVTQAAVSYFLNAAVAAELIEYRKGEPPRRLLDYVPPEWIEIIQSPESTLIAEQQESESQTIGSGPQQSTEGKSDA